MEIKIIGADQASTYRIGGTGLYAVHFTLSETPPPDWAALFDEERRLRRRAVWRKAHVRSRHIVVECALNEVDTLLEDIKEEVHNANRKYADHTAAERAKNERERHAADADRVAIDGALKKLKF